MEWSEGMCDLVVLNGKYFRVIECVYFQYLFEWLVQWVLVDLGFSIFFSCIVLFRFGLVFFDISS